MNQGVSLNKTKKVVTREDEYYVVYLGGSPKLSLKGPLCATITSTSLEFASAYFSTYKSQHFKIPLTRLKGANFMSKKQLTAWAVFFRWGLREKKNYVVIEYENQKGQTHNLTFDMFQLDEDDKQKISLIKNINSAIMAHLKNLLDQNAPHVAKKY